MGILKYDSNNSGGDWWLKLKDWQALEKAGWTVHWVGPRPKNGSLSGQLGRVYKYDNLLTKRSRSSAKSAEWLGAKAMTAAKEFDSARKGIEEWEEITGQCASDLGCGCCGSPHEFEFYKSKDDSTYISAERPSTGYMNYGD